MSSSRMLVLAIVCLFASPFVAGQPVPWSNVVSTQYGIVKGFTEDNVNVFHSVPFASPPTGDLRFKPPVAPTPWPEVKDVSAVPNACPQYLIPDLLEIGNEDCLYLDIYVPERDPDVLLPVMFWIFGGGYSIGDGDEFGWYDGKHLASTQNVIVVAVNYRVSSLGFLALKELAAESNGTTGNYGLQDQTFGLQWVQDNIHAFGGDKSKVTIFGESAGGFSVCWHLVSEASAGLFSRAIMESGSCDTPQFFRPLPDAISFGNDIAAGCGCDPTTTNDVLACLRGKTAHDLLKCTPKPPLLEDKDRLDAHVKHVASVSGLSEDRVRSNMGNLPALYPLMPWGPAIDKTSVGLMDVPLKLLQTGRFNRVPTIFGTNNNEGSIFVPSMTQLVPNVKFPPSQEGIDLVLRHCLDMYNPTSVAKVAENTLSFYPPDEFKNDTWSQTSTILTDYMFACSARRAARAISAHGVPMWLYHFEYHMDWIEYPLLGNYHTSELSFVWDNQWPIIIHDFSEKDHEMANAFGLYWGNMAHFGTPNDGEVSVQWPGYNQTTDLNIRMALPLSVTHQLRKDACDFWDAQLDILGSPTSA